MSERIRRYRLADCLQDIIDNTSSIELYVAELDEEGLAHDRLRYDAVERCLERICEAAHRLGDAAGTLMPDQPWQDIRSMGNRLRHAYDHIDMSIVWKVVTERLPQPKANAAAALERLEAGGEI
ncbi:MAG TPA: HepT-like ribonuclease domain-containing protein [Acetobacteraceae bacterium]|nr:HepT-like ribonuclease domain-containing protein [Acetobacteraceae bacterium]